MEIQFIRRHRGKLIALISIGGAGVGIYYIAKLLRSRIERYVMQKIQSGMLEMGEESKSQAYVVPTVVHFFTRSRTPLSHTPPPSLPHPLYQRNGASAKTPTDLRQQRRDRLCARHAQVVLEERTGALRRGGLEPR